MGAGAGAAAPVDNDLSPRFAAIEKAQAELRQEVAVRDERRRELEFLEKGGNPLDFQVGDVINPFRSSTDPLADQLLPIKSEASNGLQAGEIAEDSCVYGSNGRDFTDVLENQHIWSVPRSVSSGGNLEWDAKVCPALNISHDVVGTQNKLNSVKGREPGRGSWTAARGKSYIRRNRHRVKWDGFNDVNARGDIKDPRGKIFKDSATSVNLPENVVLVDSRSQALLASSVDDVSGSKRSSTVDTCQCSPMSTSIQHGNADDSLVSVPLANSTRSWTQPCKSDARYACMDEDDTKVFRPPFGEDKGDLSKSSGLSSSLCQVDSPSSLWKPSDDAEDNSCQQLPGQTCGVIETNLRLKRSMCEGEVMRAPLPDCFGKNVRGDVTCGLSIADDGDCKMEKNQCDPSSGDLSASSVGCIDPPRKRLDTAASVLLVANHEENLLPGEVVYGPESLRANFESYMVPFAPELPNVVPDAFELKDQGFPHHPSLPADECRLQNQSPAASGALAGLSRSNSRTSHPSGSSVNRFPGVVLPWEKEQDPLVIAETERRKATISAAAKKAHEDCILEEAETIRASRLQVAELDRRRPFHEPGRRKSHWDFVMEEMVWMANDFMQERLWKSAAAAQFCHSVALARLGCKAPEMNVVQTQRLVAHELAHAVLGYWRSITDAFLSSDNKAVAGINSSDGLAPMDVDVPELKEGPHSRSGTPITEYCIRYMKGYMTRELGDQAEAPSTPDQKSEQPLIYTRSEGAFEIYCDCVTTHWARIEAEHEQVRQELNFVAQVEGVVQVIGEELVNSDPMLESGYMTRMLSPRRGSSDEEVYSQNLAGNVLTGASMVNMISKKKRNFFEKAMPSKFLESVSGSRGLSVDQPVGSTACMDYSFPSVSTGKRSSPSRTPSSVVSVGTIPIKRLRTSAVAARQRAAGMCGMNVAPSTGGIPAGGRLPTGINRLQQQESLLAASPSGYMPFSGGSGPKVVQTVRNNLLFSKSKKKKKKYFSSGAVYKANIGDGDAVGLPQASLKREHLKRKGDSTLLPGPSSRSSEAGSEDFDSPGTPGIPNKKAKLFKQAPDTSPDAANSAGVAASQAATQISSVSSKLVRQNFSRDHSNRKAKPTKASSSQPGSGIPWSAAEDQAILHLVQSLGPNWELVTDVLRFNAQLKGIFRKPKHCREHHRFLVEHFSGEDGESPNDISVLQHSSALPGSTKNVLEDTGKLHFEHIVHLVQKHHLSKKNVSHGQKQHVQIHPSHANIVAQYGASGVYCTPLELCERSSTGDLTAQQYQMQPQHGGGLGPPNVLSGCPSLRPGSAGMPVLPGLQLSPPVTPSSVTLHTSTAREGQRLAQIRPFLQDETNQMRLAHAAALQRGLQQSVTSVTAGLPIIGLSDCNGPGLPTGGGPTIIGGLKRGMSLPRPGLSGLSPSMTSAGLGSMLPPGGVGINTGGLNPGAVVPAQINIIRRPRDLVHLPSGRTTEEQQRQILIQELQHQAVQGNAQAAAALSTFNNSISNSLISSPSQTFGSQQQLQSPQPQIMPHQPQSNQLQQSQQQKHAYYVQAAKERQLQHQTQQRLLHQQQIRHNSNSVQMQQQSSSVGQQQQIVQGHVHSQQSHVLSLQPPVGSQPQLSLQQQKQLLPPSLSSSSPQQQPSPPLPSAAPPPPLQSGGASTVVHGPQQVVSTQQGPDQLPQLGHGKVPSSKQVQKHQQVPPQVQPRVLKNVSRGSPTMQGLTSQAASSSGLSGHVTMATQRLSQQVGQAIQGPRSLQVHTQMHLGKQTSQALHQVSTNRLAGVSGGTHNLKKGGNAGAAQMKTSASAVQTLGASTTGASTTSSGMIMHVVETSALVQSSGPVGTGAHGPNIGPGTSGNCRGVFIASAAPPGGLRRSQDLQPVAQQGGVPVKTVGLGPARPPSSTAQHSSPLVEAGVGVEAEGVCSGQAANCHGSTCPIAGQTTSTSRLGSSM